MGCSSVFGRDDENADNSIESIKEYLQRNINDLNPIEGIYHVSLEFQIDGRKCFDGNSFDIFVDFGENRNGENSFLVSYVGYSDPFDGKMLPEEDIREIPNVCILLGYILQKPNSNLYNLRICPFGLKNEFGNQFFVLDIGANDFIVEYDSITNEGYQYFKVPKKFINKRPKLVLKAKKIFPL